MSVNDNIARNLYANTLVFPVAPERPALPSSLTTSAEVRQYAIQLEAYERSYAEYLRNWSAYQRKFEELETKFRQDIEVENLTAGNAKSQKLWDAATWFTYDTHDGEFNMMGQSELQRFSDSYRELVKLIV